MIHTHPLPRKEYCHNQSAFLCLCRDKLGGIYCVTGGWHTAVAGPGYWEFNVLHQKKTTCEEVQRGFLSLLDHWCMYIKPYQQNIFIHL